MTLKRLAFCAACMLMALGWAVTASASRTYSLAAGSGAEFHIGNGLALPVQTAVPPCLTTPNATGTPCGAFPPLLVKPAATGVHHIIGTTAMTTGQKIVVPPAALTRKAAQATVGVWFSNPGLYAVATSLSFQWPAAKATFSTGGGPRPSGSATVVIPAPIGVSSSARYSPRVAGKRFGGAGVFALQAGPNSSTSGVSPSPVTIYALTPSPPSFPPCTHTALVPPFPGPGGTGCKAALLNPYPSGIGVIGGVPNATATTPGGPAPSKGIFIGRFGGPGQIAPVLKPGQPLGTVSAGGPFTVFVGLTAMASSSGMPWTTAMLTLSAMGAVPAEKFVLSGGDTRTTKGAGAIQMVAGSLSKRVIVGDNANRAWLRLDLVQVSTIPTMSRNGLMATAALMLLAGGYAARKRLFA